MKGESKIKPRVASMKDWHTLVYPDGTIGTTMLDVEDAGSIGLFFVEPGQETTVFSLEDEDDGTAEEWYGPVHNCYYILVGQFTLWWGSDASKLRNKNAEKLNIKEGECSHHPPGWKYLVRNTGKVPGTFLWTLSAAPKGTKPRYLEPTREIHACMRIQQQRDESEEGHLSASKWLGDVIKTYDSPKVIAAHLGGLFEPRIQESAISFQTTGACTEAMEYACETVGAERVIFGSDFPFFEISDEIGKIRNAKIPIAAKTKILGNNAKKLLKLT